jgi:hypothetical protein
MTLLVVVFLLFVVNIHCQLPAAGAFVAFRNDFIASLGANVCWFVPFSKLIVTDLLSHERQMSQKLQALVNADQPADINGKNGKTTYTLYDGNDDEVS